jgi:hypothetical protein
MDTSVANAEPVVAPESAPVDPFSLDESKLVSLSPEQRAALDPVFEEWKTKAKSEIERSGKTYEEKYRPHQEKADALDQLVRDPRFVSWWQNMQQAAANKAPQAAGAVENARPQDFASPEEWQSAISEAYAGDPAKMQSIQARMFATMATPVVQQLRAGQEELRATLEMKDLFERHSDAKELDAIGRNPSDPKDSNKSLLEFALEWADANRLPLEQGYALARKWADGIRVGAKQEAMGLVEDKKKSITSGPSTTKGSAPVVEVADSDELMARNMEYLASGQTPPRFVIRPPQAKQSQWAQRT